MLWFKHQSNANSDNKLQNVLLDYGLEGYGLYWYCLELIVNRVDKDDVTFELKHDARIIARNTGSTVQKVEEMMKRFVELGLFESSEGRITCLKLLKRMDSSMTSNSFMRNLILKANEHHDGVMTESDSVMLSSANVMKEESRVEENRKEKIIKQTPLKMLMAMGLSEQLSKDWLAVRKAKKSAPTQTAFDSIKKHAEDNGYTFSEAIKICIDRSWVGFNVDWIAKEKPVSNYQQSITAGAKTMFGSALNKFTAIEGDYESVE